MGEEQGRLVSFLGVPVRVGVSSVCVSLFSRRCGFAKGNGRVALCSNEATRVTDPEKSTQGLYVQGIPLSLGRHSRLRDSFAVDGRRGECMQLQRIAFSPFNTWFVVHGFLDFRGSLVFHSMISSV